MRFAVWVNARQVAPGVALVIPVDPIDRSKKEAFPAWTICRDAKKALCSPFSLRRRNACAVLGMKEADQDAAVGHSAFETDLAFSPQRFFQGQVVQPIRINGHPLGKTAIASVDDTAQLAG